jgi:hypothetical protein
LYNIYPRTKNPSAILGPANYLYSFGFNVILLKILLHIQVKPVKINVEIKKRRGLYLALLQHTSTQH